MAKYAWSGSEESEFWPGTGNSVGECLKEAKESGYKTVAIGTLSENYVPKITDVDEILERILEEDEVREIDFDMLESVQQNEFEVLEKALNFVLRGWLETYGITFSSHVESWDLYEVATGRVIGAKERDRIERGIY